MYTGDRPPGFGLAFVAVLVGGFAGSFATGVLTLGYAAGPVATQARVSLAGLLFAAIVAVAGRTLLSAFVMCRVITYCGAYVSYGRALAALIVGGVIGQVVTLALVVGTHTGSGYQLSSGLWMLMPLVGLGATLWILASPGRTAGAELPVERYHVPPGAPPEWPGR